ncbi:MAG: type I glutamate--ammonia ligase [Oscillospiraceae bacterium]|nr:type I glutamate--ammonia ligase [Oscillospiraceae bacterium]
MFGGFGEMERYIRENGIKVVDFKVTDLAGRWRHLTVNASKVTEATLSKGIGFDGSSYGFLKVERSDMVFRPDIGTAFVDPASEAPALAMVCDVYGLGEGGQFRYGDDPRHVAEKAEAYLGGLGIADRCLFGPEFEFYVLDSVNAHVGKERMGSALDSGQAEWRFDEASDGGRAGNRGYKIPANKGYHADLPRDSSHDLRNAMILSLEDAGVPVKYHHHENGGPGQVEIEVDLATLREVCDRTQKLKYIVRNAAHKAGRTVTFMPKPFHGEAGSGMHVHLQMMRGGEPAFYDAAGYAGLSETALYAIGGILTHAAALMAFTNPSTNSYKRLVPGYEAPVTVSFSMANRSSVIRVPGYATDPGDKRFEFRPPDATANPYLCMSAILMAAIDGIKGKVDPTKAGFGPFDKNMYLLSDEERKAVRSLPKSIDEAAEALEADRGFLLKGGVFTDSLIEGQIRRIRQDGEEIGRLPHPAEFIKYYDL